MPGCPRVLDALVEVESERATPVLAPRCARLDAVERAPQAFEAQEFVTPGRAEDTDPSIRRGYEPENDFEQRGAVLVGGARTP